MCIRDRGGGSGKPKKPKPKLQDAGFLDWQGYSANYARLRHSVADAKGEAAGTRAGTKKGQKKRRGKDEKAYETVRVNLSTGGRCIIAYVRFPIGRVGTKTAVSELLSAFEPLP